MTPPGHSFNQTRTAAEPYVDKYKPETHEADFAPANSFVIHLLTSTSHQPAETAAPATTRPPLPLQARLEVGAVNDPLEHDADRIAQQVMRMPDGDTPSMSRCACGGTAGPDGECASCRTKRLARAAVTPAAPARREAPPSVHATLAGTGRALDSQTRAFFEPRLGVDLGAVRVHDDALAAASAHDVQAHAYTVGHDIVFGAGRYQSGSPAERDLLAHELVHVVQQGATTHRPTEQQSRPHDPGRRGTDLPTPQAASDSPSAPGAVASVVRHQQAIGNRATERLQRQPAPLGADPLTPAPTVPRVLRERHSPLYANAAEVRAERDLMYQWLMRPMSQADDSLIQLELATLGPDLDVNWRYDPSTPLSLPKPSTNAALSESMFPARGPMLKKFVAIYRELELGPKVTKAARERIQADVAGLSGASLQKEVDRLLDGTVVPAWLKSEVREYSGLRYRTAHRTYYSPLVLVYLIKRENGEYGRKQHTGPQAAKAIEGLGDETSAMNRLAQMRARGGSYTIPDWAWHKIVRLTPLSALYGNSDSLKEAKETPEPRDTAWVRIMKAWGDKTIGTFETGGQHWRKEAIEHLNATATGLVCNQVAETLQAHRGVTLPGGIRKNAEHFAAAEIRGAKPNAPARVAGSYLKPVKSAADLRPGASLFWINKYWTPKPKNGDIDNSAMVFPIDGLQLPTPLTPEYVADWTAWKQRSKVKTDWDKATEKGRPTTGPDPGEAGEEPHLTTLARGVELVDDWTYTVVAGQPITRERGPEKQWMTWMHQATVLSVTPDERVFTFDTVQLDKKTSAVGPNTRALKDLISDFVYVGYTPGTAP